MFDTRSASTTYDDHDSHPERDSHSGGQPPWVTQPSAARAWPQPGR
jgi:hypothetical protein